MMHQQLEKLSVILSCLKRKLKKLIPFTKATVVVPIRLTNIVPELGLNSEFVPISVQIIFQTPQDPMRFEIFFITIYDVTTEYVEKYNKIVVSLLPRHNYFLLTHVQHPVNETHPNDISYAT